MRSKSNTTFSFLCPPFYIRNWRLTLISKLSTRQPLYQTGWILDNVFTKHRLVSEKTEGKKDNSLMMLKRLSSDIVQTEGNHFTNTNKSTVMIVTCRCLENT